MSEIAIQEKSLGGRPSEFLKEYIGKVDEYLDSQEDEEVEVVRQSNEKKGYEIFDTKIKVRLPTIEGFARFLNVSKRSLYNWEKESPEFLHALEKIRTEQQERLINKGLSGEYNPTIAKLILSSNHGFVEKTEKDERHLHLHMEIDEKKRKVIEEYEEKLKELETK